MAASAALSSCKKFGLGRPLHLQQKGAFESSLQAYGISALQSAIVPVSLRLDSLQLTKATRPQFVREAPSCCLLPSTSCRADQHITNWSRKVCNQTDVIKRRKQRESSEDKFTATRVISRGTRHMVSPVEVRALFFCSDSICMPHVTLFQSAAWGDQYVQLPIQLPRPASKSSFQNTIS